MKHFLLLFLIVICFSACKKKTTSTSPVTPTSSAPTSTLTEFSLGSNGGLNFAINNSDEMIVGTPYSGVKFIKNSTMTTYTWTGYASEIARTTCVDRQNNLCFSTDVGSFNPPQKYFKVSGTNVLLVNSFSSPGSSTYFMGNSVGTYYYYDYNYPSQLVAYNGTTVTPYTYTLSPSMTSMSYFQIDNNDIVWYRGQTLTWFFTGYFSGGVFTNVTFNPREFEFDALNNLWGLDTGDNDTILKYDGSVLTKISIKNNLGFVDKFETSHIALKNNKVFVLGTLKIPSSPKLHITIYNTILSTWKDVDLSNILSSNGYSGVVWDFDVDSQDNIWCLLDSPDNKLVKITTY